jgi:hypothetical protein
LGRPKTRGGESTIQEAQPEVFEIDILYENQRGSFFFGLPMFSHNSLLNLDPAPWSNAVFKDSPVDVITAQVPNPSWAWAWNSWYVDMSGDVDEEGWSYSFAFSPKFSWHGTHVWFNSNVRRRRWLRKRVKTTTDENYLDEWSEPLLQTPPAEMSSQLNHVPEGDEVQPNSSPKDLDGNDSTTSKGDLETLIQKLKDGRLDREKIQFVEQYLDALSELTPQFVETV